MRFGSTRRGKRLRSNTLAHEVAKLANMLVGQQPGTRVSPALVVQRGEESDQEGHRGTGGDGGCRPGSERQCETRFGESHPASLG